MSSGIVKSTAQSQMEQPMKVCCIDCQWYGYEDELIQGRCPDCSGDNI